MSVIEITKEMFCVYISFNGLSLWNSVSLAVCFQDYIFFTKFASIKGELLSVISLIFRVIIRCVYYAIKVHPALAKVSVLVSLIASLCVIVKMSGSPCVKKI